jgi:YebC/PmpR family DNA-binding regulatory protein
MGRGPVIERQKQLNAAARGKSFTLHAKLVAIAAAKWADPLDNPSLAEAIYKAKKDNVTNEVIDRAIARGAGLNAGESMIESVVFEGYAAGGVAIVATALTDNRNRTVSSVRHAFSKCGANLGESGSVTSFAFRFAGQMILAGDLTEGIEEDIIESGAQDYHVSEEGVIVECAWTEFAQIKKFFTQKWYTLLESGGEYMPTNTVELTEFDKALKVHTLIATLEEDEDIEFVWHNAIIPADIAAQITTHLESNRFRT